MKIIGKNNISDFSDNELINKLKEGADGIDMLYKRHKDYCMNFMKSKYNDYEEVNDIYHDAVIVFYEKVHTPGFELTCSIQTYLNTVCYNQILKRLNQSKRYKIENSEDNSGFIENIKDVLEDIDDVNNERIKVMKEVLLKMKEASSKCYEMLVRFWYRNQNMDDIANTMGFSNSDSAKSQKAKCQKQFKIEVYNRLMS
jgi:RNA polymerase sigma factor (sigma-70 family)